MFEIVVSFNADAVKRSLQAYERQSLPTMIAVASTRVAREDVIPAEKAEMVRVFDNPVPWTLNGMRVRPANANGTSALVYWEESTAKGTAAADYLVPQVQGGGRKHTPLENRLIAIGAMPANWYVVPGRYAQKNARGNLAVGQIGKILSSVGGLAGVADVGPNPRNRGKRRAEVYVVIRKGIRDLRPGIYQRKGGQLLPILIYVAQPHYTMRFDFKGVAQRTLAENFARRFREVRLEMAGGRFKGRQAA